MSKQNTKKSAAALSVLSVLVLASSSFVAVDYLIFNQQSYRVFVGMFNAVVALSIFVYYNYKAWK